MFRQSPVRFKNVKRRAANGFGVEIYRLEVKTPFRLELYGRLYKTLISGVLIVQVRRFWL